jgi:hypothetical protein
MKRALTVTGLALVLAPAALVAGYYGVQAYLDWLIAGAKRPLDAPARPGPTSGSTAQPPASPGLGT